MAEMTEVLAAFDLWDDEEQCEAGESADDHKRRVTCRCPLECCVNGRARGRRLRRRLGRKHAMGEATRKHACERLLRACEAGDAAAVAQLLHCGDEERDPCWPDALLHSPLSHVASAPAAAAFAKHAHNFFWRRGGAVNAIIHAATTGRAAAVRALLDTGVRANTKNPDRSTRALRAAIETGSILCVQVLLEFGAEASALLGNGTTFLHLAAFVGHADVLEMLLEGNTQLETVDEGGQTPLSIAAGCGWVECVRLLLQHGANIHNRDEESLTPLLAAARNNIPWEYRKLKRERKKKEGCKGQRESEAEDHAGTVRALVAAGADINEFTSIEDYGREITALMFAMLSGSDEVVQTLIDLGADVNFRTSLKETALHFSAHRTSGCLKKLLSAGADLEARNESGETALSLAAKFGCEDTVKFYLEAGAQVMTIDNEGYTPLHLAAKSGRAEVICPLLKAGANVEAQSIDGRTAMHFGAASSRAGVVALAEAGASVNDVDAEGRTPLHFAAGCWDPACLESLIELGADLMDVDHRGWNALHFAAHSGNERNATRLVKMGISPDSRSFNGETPLHIAVLNMQTNISCILVRKLRASVNARDNMGKTALHIAAGSTDDWTLKQLIECGANRKIRDNDGLLPVDIATDPVIQRILHHWGLAG